MCACDDGEESYASMFLEIESNHDECNDGEERERETRHRKLRVISAAMTPMTAFDSYIYMPPWHATQYFPYPTRKLC